MSIIARDDDFPIFMVGTNSPAKSRASFYCPDYYYYYQIVQTRFESAFNVNAQCKDILFFYRESCSTSGKLRARITGSHSHNCSDANSFYSTGI